MAKAKEKKSVQVLRVASGREGFRRAGFVFGREPKDIPLADLSKEQIKALKDDAALVCVETTAEVEVEAAAEEAGK